MVRRVATAGLAAGVLVLAACGGTSPGLRPFEQGGVGFNLRCGETANWEAAILANELKRPVTVNAIGLEHVPPGFTLEWARVYRGIANEVDESKAKRSILGQTIPPTRQNKFADPVGWHLVVGLKPPDCPPESRRPEFDAREYKIQERALELGYRVGSEQRHVRLGGDLEMVVCAGRRGCSP